MQLNQLRYLLEVAKTRNISKAAGNLYLSQPSLTQQIQKLEQELGVPLLIRHTKSVSLTEAGEQFVIQASHILNSADDLRILMEQYKNLMAGELRLGLTSICGYLRLLELLKDFQEEQPGIQYHLTFRISGELLQLLKTRELQAAFVVGSEAALAAEPDLYCYQLTRHTDEYVAVLPKNHPLQEREQLQLKDLDGYSVIMPSKQSVFYKQLDLAMHMEGTRPHILCFTSQNDVIGQLLEEELGIAFVTRQIAEILCPEGGRIVPLETKITRDLFYVTRKELLDYPSIRAFTEYVEDMV